MNYEILALIAGSLLVYVSVLLTYACRLRWGKAPFYVLLGSLTAIMSWITDVGVVVEAGGVTFKVGSTIFYTALLLGVFVVYVFEGPIPTRHLIFAVIAMSILMPLLSAIVHAQTFYYEVQPLVAVPRPSLRVNSASVVATLLDLIFLVAVWEFLGKPTLRVHLWFRTFLTLLGVMWLDVLLFTTGAFWGTPVYCSIMAGTLISRFFVSVFTFPLLYGYLRWQGYQTSNHAENRPVLSILVQMATLSEELSEAQSEIVRRKEAEAALKKALSEVKTLQGLIPICAGCKKIRDDAGYWEQIEIYLRKHSDVEFSHGMCSDCMKKYYPSLP